LFGIKRKKIPGHEFAGRIEEIGKDVNRFSVGDKVFGTTTGLSRGSNAEYVCVPEKWDKGVVARMPTDATYEEATALPVGGMTALTILNQGNIQNGQRVLIYGSSGSVCTYAVQLAKYQGAHVTGVCSSRNVDIVKDLGADQVIDYTEEGFIESDQLYDVVFDAVGKIAEQEAKIVLTENGIFLTVQKPTQESLRNLKILSDLLEQGKIKPVIDTFYRLGDTANAHRFVEAGHKIGNIVISMTPQGSGVVI
jgi:NADPH:quinone reductase-like Zn-dependent oxidoreductase